MTNHKEFKFLEKDWCDYVSITLLWPSLNWGRVTDAEDYDAFISGGKKYSLELKNSLGYYRDNCSDSLWFILFGFGFCIKKQDGY